MMKPKYLPLLLVMVLASSCTKSDHEVVIDYFGQSIPSEKAKVFAPGIISLENRWEGNINFSANGKELYLNVFTDSLRHKRIYHSRYHEGKWAPIAVLTTLGDHDNWEPFLSYTGQELFFVSARPPGNKEWNGRIWKSTRSENNNWNEPEMIDLGYDTKNGFWFPNYSLQDDNIMYFGGNIEALPGRGKGDLHYFNFEEEQVVNIRELNSTSEEWDPFIAPDGSYLLWASDRDGGYGGTDLYISFRENETWGDPINLGEKVNSDKYEVAPRISSDGKVLFFDRPENGTQDIYWISSAFIEALRK